MRSPHQRSRRFSALDMAILMASTAAGIAWIWLSGTFQYILLITLDDGPFVGLFLYVLPCVALVVDPLLAGWTLAWLILRSRGPRPPWRRLFRRPGTTVGLVAILAWFAGGLVTLRWGADVHHGTPDWSDYGCVLLASSTMLGGFGIGVARAGSALDGRWRPEPRWIDRMGRALGVGWIALSIPSGVMLGVIIGPYY